MFDDYKLLTSRDILDILDGDALIEENGDIRITMPYLSGPDICGISKIFGFDQEYNFKKGFANLSRWQYLSNLIDYTIKNGTICNLLHYLFSIDKFKKMFRNLSTPEEVNEMYNYAINKIIAKINTILLYSNYELIVSGNSFNLRKIGESVSMDTPLIKCIDREYIKKLADRAHEDIDNNNYDSAITKARTILEEVFCYLIEKKDIAPNDDGDIQKLFKQVKDLYNMHADKNMDIRYNKLISGLEIIVQSIAEMRNSGSDSHGVGSKRIPIYDHHAKLSVNAAVAMSEFLLSISIEEEEIESLLK